MFARQYDSYWKDYQRLSGVGGGEVTELADLLIIVREVRNDMTDKKDATRAKKKGSQEMKERFRASIIAASTSRRKIKDGINKKDPGDERKVASIKSSLKKRIVCHRAGKAQMKMNRFGEHFNEADLARIDIEKHCLDFERKQ